MDSETRFLDDIARAAWQAGSDMDLEGCHYGQPHWEGGFVHRPFPYYHFLAGLVRSRGLYRILEIGTHMGGSIAAMYRGIREEHLEKAKVLTLDVTDLSDEQLRGLPAIKKIQGDALEARFIQETLSYFQYQPIHLLYIDATHYYKHTIAMLGLYGFLLHPTFIVLDDIYLNPSMQKMWYDLSRLYPGHILGLDQVSEKIREKDAGFGLISLDHPIKDFSRVREEISDLLQRGEESYQRGDHDAAELHFRNVLKRDPLNDEALNNLGVLSWGRGEGKTGLEYLQKAFNLDPRNERTARNLAEVLSAAGLDTVLTPAPAPPGKAFSAETPSRIPGWHEVALPEKIENVTTMLSIEERRFLYAAGKYYWKGIGSVVDAGCFLGGSTLPLGMGVLENKFNGPKEKIIHSYDLFRADKYARDQFLSKHGNYATGDSTRPIFDEHVRDIVSVLDIHEGDIASFPWNGDDIELLFLDVVKTWKTNDFVVREYFPCLIPGHSLVIQQDFVFWGYPWLAITMEYFSGYFEPIEYVPRHTIVFLAKKKIPGSMIGNHTISSLPDKEKLRLMGEAINRYGKLLEKGDLVELECARALLEASLLGADEAKRSLIGIWKDYQGYPRTNTAIQGTDKTISGPK